MNLYGMRRSYLYRSITDGLYRLWWSETDSVPGPVYDKFQWTIFPRARDAKIGTLDLRPDNWPSPYVARVAFISAGWCAGSEQGDTLPGFMQIQWCLFL